jgi:DNA-binding response OmpR family regulator
MHIGLVEEDPTLVELLQVVLGRGHHTLTVLDDPRARSLVLFLSNLGQDPLPYDLLLIDIPLGMPELDLLARLQEQWSPRPLPLIVLTASSAEKIEQARLSFPALHFVQKPFHLTHLLAVIEAASRNE